MPQLGRHVQLGPGTWGAGTCIPADKGYPYFWDGGAPHGYKIWVGDMPTDSTLQTVRERIKDTLIDCVGISKFNDLWYDIRKIDVKPSRA